MNEEQKNRDLNRRVGIAIRGYRNKNDLTQQDLAGRAGVSQVTISQVEAGSRSNLNTLDKIACALGVELSGIIIMAESVKDLNSTLEDAEELLREFAP